MFRLRAAGLFSLILLMTPSVAGAIPAFARRYRVSCSLCHNPVPRLTPFGETFAGNGFRFAVGEAPRDTIATGDPLLSLQNSLPLAVRVDAYAQAFSEGRVVADFGTPYIIKLLSSGPISNTFSYYMYVNLLERGEFGGFEDAILIANDLFGAVDVQIGQFQASDPLFKRELRLMFEDYAIYRTRVGDEPANLTYDRGLLASADVGGFTVMVELLNGNGIGEVDSERRFDGDTDKNVAGRVTRELADGIRLGAFGYYGRSKDAGLHNRLTMVGGDATLGIGALELNLQYLHREDTNPLFRTTATRVRTDGGFAELVWQPGASRWHGFALYNLVTADAPLVDVRMGTPAGLDRYQTLSAGAGYLLQRNLRLTGETMWDFELERVRWTIGFVTAF